MAASPERTITGGSEAGSGRVVPPDGETHLKTPTDAVTGRDARQLPTGLCSATPFDGLVFKRLLAHAVADE